MAIPARLSAPATPTSALAGPSGACDRRTRVGLGLLAAALVLLSFRLPLWQARLSAPQYPAGLTLTAYGDRVEGDLAEIDELNHYVGVEPFDPRGLPELALWGPTVVAALLLVATGTLGGRRSLGRLARFAMWLVPLGVLADVQYRLYGFGHSVDPEAAIRIDPFTPLVVGPTKVLNFTTWAYPGEALWALTGAAILVTFGPGVVRKLVVPRGRAALARAVRDAP